MLFNAIVLGDLRVAIPRLTTGTGLPIVAVHRVLSKPVELAGQMAIRAQHSSLQPVDIAWHALVLALVFVFDTAEVTFCTVSAESLFVCELMTGYQASSHPVRAADVALTASEGVTPLAVICHHGLELRGLFRLAAGEQHGSISGHVGMQAVLIGGDLFSVAGFAHTGRTRLVGHPLVGILLHFGVTPTAMAANAAEAAMDRCKEFILVQVHLLPCFVRG